VRRTRRPRRRAPRLPWHPSREPVAASLPRTRTVRVSSW
jgi:hypothetical protein